MADVASALKDAETKMNKAVEVAKDDFATVRTGRAHPSIFNKVMVDYYGTYTALSQLASIQVPEARMALISPFDKGAMASIEKAIRESDLGVNPGNDGSVIRVNFPQLTEERRKELTKLVRNRLQHRRRTRTNARAARVEELHNDALIPDELAHPGGAKVCLQGDVNQAVDDRFSVIHRGRGGKGFEQPAKKRGRLGRGEKKTNTTNFPLFFLFLFLSSKIDCSLKLYCF